MSTENVQVIAKTLQSLDQYEIDASFMLSQAMGSISNSIVSDKLNDIRNECEEDIKELSKLIQNYGGEAPSHNRDFKGFFMQGYVGMRGLISDKGVMGALHSNTKMLVNAFEKALDSNLPEDVRTKVKETYERAKQHMDYFSSQS